MIDDTDTVRAEIRVTAEARAEATVYSLNNPYLTQREKVMVEAVYQFPMGVQHFAFAYFALWMGYSFWEAWLSSTAVGVAAWILARFLPGRLFWPIGLVFAGTINTVLILALAVAAIVVGRYGIAAYLAASSFALTSFIEAPMWLWSATRQMNPKYLIAKRMFGTTFPFETIID